MPAIQQAPVPDVNLIDQGGVYGGRTALGEVRVMYLASSQRTIQTLFQGPGIVGARSHTFVCLKTHLTTSQQDVRVDCKLLFHAFQEWICSAFLTFSCLQVLIVPFVASLKPFWVLSYSGYVSYMLMLADATYSSPRRSPSWSCFTVDMFGDLSLRTRRKILTTDLHTSPMQQFRSVFFPVCVLVSVCVYVCLERRIA